MMKKNLHTDLNSELQKYIAERTLVNGGLATSMEELNQWIAEFMVGYNSRQLNEFEGYSPKDIHCIINDLWGENSIVKIKKLDVDDFEQIPIFRQVRHLIDILLKDGKIKLTATNALPVKIVKELYSMGVSDEYVEKGCYKIQKEKDSITVQLTHILLKLMKIVKEQKGVMTFTKKGEEIAASNQKLFELMLHSFTTEFNFGYFDRIQSENAAILGNGFTLLLVSKYGDVERSYKFYAKKYFAAFPELLKEIVPRYDTVENEAAHCYEIRSFSRYMEYFGFIELKRVGNFIERSHDVIIKKSQLFDKVFQILRTS